MTHKQLTAINLVVFFILALSITVLSSCTRKQNDNILDQALDSGEPLLFINFDKTFARRFSLPVPEASTLSEHLYAIALEINRIDNRYQCSLHLYVDDQLTLYVPGNAGRFDAKPLAEYFFVKEYNAEDQAWNSAMIHQSLMRVLFRSQSLDSSDQALASTLHYSRVHRQFLPGLSLYSLETECPLFEKQNFPADIWIQTAKAQVAPIGHEDPRRNTFKENAYRFTVPMALVDKIQPYIVLAVAKNYAVD